MRTLANKALGANLTEEQKKQKEAEKIARAESRAKQRKKIIVSVDFGTTNSGQYVLLMAGTLTTSTGIAIVNSTATATDVRVLRWTGDASNVLEKCPSRICLPDPENGIDEKLIGYDVEPGMQSWQWFKLLLDAKTEPTEFDDPLLKQTVGKGHLQLPKGMTAIDLTAEFLESLYRYALHGLKEQLGAEAVDQTPIMFSLSLPATWSHAAREATRTAAMQAGFLSRRADEMFLVDEPECAAIATLKDTITGFDDNHPFQVRA
jgi:hypothetical protein